MYKMDDDNTMNQDPTPMDKAQDEPRLEQQPTVEVIDSDHSRSVEFRSVEDVMEDSYLRYSMSVIVSRALPDVRDGLKPVHRRILYSMERSEEHTSELQSRPHLVCRLLLEKKKIVVYN